MTVPASLAIDPQEPLEVLVTAKNPPRTNEIREAADQGSKQGQGRRHHQRTSTGRYHIPRVGLSAGMCPASQL